MNGLPHVIPVTDGALLALRKTRFWVLFLGVIGVILAVIGGIMILAALLALHRNMHAGVLLISEGVIFMAVFILLAVWQLGYSGALRQIEGDTEAANAALERALLKQRSLWRLLGVIMIVVLVLGIAIGIFSAIWGQQFLANMPMHP